ncbi:hypothetical protein Vi05172_g4846 [Venturia inaequalis]|nr:hypothetical protein Vi05172_g4846 [Venturia inaequalis]
MARFLLAFAATACAAKLGIFPNLTCPAAGSQLRTDTTPIGYCPGDFDIRGPRLEVVYESALAPTGLGLAPNGDIYFTYARNMEVQKWTLTKKVNFTSEVPWPSEKWQNCAAGQDVATCFVNVQNVVLDAEGVFWVIDSGVPNGASFPIAGAPKIISFNISTAQPIRTYIYPTSQYNAKLQLNDIKINNTLGYAFITEDSSFGSITTLDLEAGTFIRHLYNTTYTKPDAQFTSMYNGEPIRNWNGTTPSYMSSGTNGIALANGNCYWGIKSSHRYYFVSQQALVSNLTDAELGAKVELPGTFPSEGAGYTADDRGRIYMMASEQNAILYIDTLQSEMTDEINGVAPGGTGLVPTQNLIFKTFLRTAQAQAADTAAILDGWLYFTTNQQGLAPLRQYRNIDRRVGPFRSYRAWIGRGPAE